MLVASTFVLGLLPPPALGESHHRGLARRLIAVDRRAIFVVPEGQRPHLRRSDRAAWTFNDAADDNALLAPWQVPALCAEGGGSGHLRNPRLA
jgi:hypothetical protein